MSSDDEEDLVVRFDNNPRWGNVGAAPADDTTNYMALHHAARLEKENPNHIERTVRSKRAPKLKMSSSLLLAPHGLPLLAKQCRQVRQQRKQGSEGIQLARIIQLYDTWAQQLCPGYDLGVFYSKMEKMGSERAVRDLTETLIAGRHTDDFETLQPHTTTAESLIREHRTSVTEKQKKTATSDEEIELEIEESEAPKRTSHTVASIPHQPQPKQTSSSAPSGDYSAPEGMDFDDYGGDDDY
jgi:hypothetical protein